VTELEQQLGRVVAAFDLSIEVVALDDSAVLVQEDGFALITAGLMADHDAYRSWLTRVLREVA
jgi:hypothetical protein